MFEKWHRTTTALLLTHWSQRVASPCQIQMHCNEKATGYICQYHQYHPPPSIQSRFAMFRNWPMSLAQDFDTFGLCVKFVWCHLYEEKQKLSTVDWHLQFQTFQSISTSATCWSSMCQMDIKRSGSKILLVCFLPWIDPKSYSACSQYWILAILQFADRGHQYHFHGLKWMWSVLPI